MRFLAILIFLPLFSFAQSNKLLLGTWVKAKAAMKDGSRIVDHNGCGMDFVKYNFINEDVVNMGNDVLFDGFKYPYKLKGDSLTIIGTTFKVIELTKDSLKLSFFAPGLEDNQIVEYYFVKIPEYKASTKATYNTELKDSVYEATNELFPQCKSTVYSLLEALTTKFDKGTLTASFIVNKKGHIKEFNILRMDSISKGFANFFGSKLDNLDWVPAIKNDLPVNVIVQITLKFNSKDQRIFKRVRITNGLHIEYDFLPKPPYPPLNKEEEKTKHQYLKSAINEINNGNNDKAIELLNKCIEIDNIDLNAYYFRAMINLNIGKSKEACKDWSILAGLGQVAAVINLAQYCKN